MEIILHKKSPIEPITWFDTCYNFMARIEIVSAF